MTLIPLATIELDTPSTSPVFGVLCWDGYAVLLLNPSEAEPQMLDNGRRTVADALDYCADAYGRGGNIWDLRYLCDDSEDYHEPEGGAA